MPRQRVQSLKGSLLLDGGRLGGSYFNRTVVLVCRHDAAGAMGLVLNQPDDRRLGKVLDEDVPPRLENEPLYIGGPVQPTALSFLHSSPTLLSSNVIDHLQVGHELEELIRIGSGWQDTHRLRVFAGYAGWSAGQLDDEMRRESWLTHPASLELVFDVDPPHLWRHILKSRPSWQERILADAPEDLGLN
jgi:putative transcriptional regulator